MSWQGGEKIVSDYDEARALAQEQAEQGRRP